jgi:hypothetical protein
LRQSSLPLPRKALNLGSSCFHLLSSLDYGHVPSCLAKSVFLQSERQYYVDYVSQERNQKWKIRKVSTSVIHIWSTMGLNLSNSSSRN